MTKERIFSLRLTVAMRNALGVAAKRERRSIGSLVEKVVADYLTREGIPWEEASSCHNRRRHPRIDVFLPARLRIEETPETAEETEALIENMSLGGFYVTYTNGHRPPWKLQSSIRLIARIPGTPDPLDFLCRAVRVIHDREMVGIGLQHCGIPEETLALIDWFLQSRPSPSGPLSR